jgi:transcriptional regulator with XRE-family HTH domain
MKLRNVLQKYLDETGLTAAALATKAKVPKTTLAGWLAGKTPRDFQQLRAISRATGLTLEQLLFDEDSGPHEIQLKAEQISPFNLSDSSWQSAFLEVKYRAVKRP